MSLLVSLLLKKKLPILHYHLLTTWDYLAFSESSFAMCELTQSASHMNHHVCSYAQSTPTYIVTFQSLPLFEHLIQCSSFTAGVCNVSQLELHLLFLLHHNCIFHLVSCILIASSVSQVCMGGLSCQGCALIIFIFPLCSWHLTDSSASDCELIE